MPCCVLGACFAIGEAKMRKIGARSVQLAGTTKPLTT